MKRKKKDYRLIAQGPDLRKFLICLKEGKTYLRSKVELGLATKYFHTHAHLFFEGKNYGGDPHNTSFYKF
jgi:hypothetical protein